MNAPVDKIISAMSQFERHWPYSEERDDMNCSSGSLIPFNTDFDGFNGYNPDYDILRTFSCILFSLSLKNELIGNPKVIHYDVTEYAGFGVMRKSLYEAVSPLLNICGIEQVPITDYALANVMLSASESEYDYSFTSKYNNGLKCDEYYKRFIHEMETVGIIIPDELENLSSYENSYLYTEHMGAFFFQGNGCYVCHDDLLCLAEDLLFDCDLFPCNFDFNCYVFNAINKGVKGILLIYGIEYPYRNYQNIPNIGNTLNYSALFYIAGRVRNKTSFKEVIAYG